MDLDDNRVSGRRAGTRAAVHRGSAILRVTVSAGLLVLAASLGCRSDSRPVTRIDSRWLEAEADSVFDPDSIRIEAPVFDFEFAGGRPRDRRWHLQRKAAQDEARVDVVGTVDFDAGEVQAIEVSLHHDTAGFMKVRLFWASPGQATNPERSMLLTGSAGIDPETTVHRFELADHPEWRGTIGRLRLTATLAGGIAARRITGLSVRYSTDRIAGIAGRSLKVTLDSDVRNAVVGEPRKALRQRFSVPAHGRFRFAYGFLGLLTDRIEYSVGICEDGRREETVFEAILEPADRRSRGWHSGEVDLSRWAGREVDLVLRAGSVADSRDDRGLPVWANPEMTTRSAGEAPMNVVLVSIDTLRSDRMSLYGYDRPTTPNLAKWAASSGVVFLNTVAQASWTLPSHVSMLTGIGAFTHGVNYDSPAPPSLTLISETLRNHGYRTAAVTGGGYLHPHFNLSQGFDRFHYWSGVDQQTGVPIDGAEFELDLNLERATRWITDRADEPFFLFFHTYDIHYRLRSREPYFSRFSNLTVPENLRWSMKRPQPDDGYRWDKFLVLRGPKGDRRLPGELADLPGDIYDSRIAYLDSRLGDLFQALEGAGVSDRTIVIITSDHGELLGEHGLYEHLSLFDENLMIPLVIAVPGVARAGAMVEDQVRSIDIVPTVLDLLDLPADGEIEGRSLRPLLIGGDDGSGREAWSYAAASNFGMALRVDNATKVVFNNVAWKPVNGAVDLYDVTRRPEVLVDPPPQPVADALVHDLTRRYTSEMPGLWVTFRNPGNEAVRFEIRGEFVGENSVKSTDAECRCVSFVAKGRARLAVAAGASVTLVFEDYGNRVDELELVRLSGREWNRATLKIPEIGAGSDPVVVECRSSGLVRPAAPGDQQQLTVVLRRAGRGQSGNRHSSDDGLEDRLRALGYIQ